MAGPTFKSEAELAAVFVAWLRQEGWDVYEEVCFGQCAADIVATRAGLVWVIETKRSLGFGVLEQARNWRPYAHYVSVGVPHAKESDGRALAIETAAWLGVGVLEARPGRCEDRLLVTDWLNWHSTHGYLIREYPAPLHRSAHRKVGELLAHLVPQQQNGATPAGNAEGLRSTVFSRSAETIRTHLASLKDGSDVKSLVTQLGKLHYANAASARQTILRRAQQGLIPGVAARQVEGKWRLFSAAEGNA